jgi:hypothetical protein
MENLNQHLALYYQAFQSQMPRPLHQQPAPSSLPNSQTGPAHNNFGLNFGTTFYPLQNRNSKVRLDFSNQEGKVPSILKAIVTFYRESSLIEEYRRQVPNQILEMLKQEY